jgi:HSP20 family protein
MAMEVEKPGKREASRREGQGKEAVGTAENLVEMESALLPDAAIYESDGHLLIRLDLPGVEKGQVQIEVDGTNTLQIRAKNGFREPGGILFREFSVGDYYRSFRLGQEYDKDAITARLEDGVLELVANKKEEVKPKRISIIA